MKQRTGCVYRSGGSWYAKVSWSDQSATDPKTEKAKRRWRKRKASSKAQASAYRDEMLHELDTGVTDEQRRISTFRDIANRYMQTVAVPPRWENDVRIAGMTDWRSVHAIIKNVLIPYLGARSLKTLNYAELRRFRDTLLNAPRKRGGSIVAEVEGKRSLARVNRVMAWCRAILNFGVECRVLAINPMTEGKSLVVLSAEKPRDRVLSIDEEQRLLFQARTRPEFHRLHDLLIIALDTGMRRGEVLRLEFDDVNLDERWMTLRAATTKTRRTRRVPLSARAHAVLVARRDRYGAGRVFPEVTARIVAADFPTLCGAASVHGFRLHDARRTLAVRLVQHGLSVPEIALITGHRITEAEAKTLQRHYIAADVVTLRRATEMLDSMTVN